ncbi:DUF6519 domain-containing protein [Saccharothrix luteola]|uniref:DUF6519 domain-containing protein n=1 Tax=Saccharothrix luteola TaxID=2893018 RepID=UPI001E43BECA|nr:DUF6519 domain-containing protein [Saccharothrix luteola]MCC8250467.1 DUF6519 domain-containing protein [Saccharothrix luteola]
MHGDFSKLGFRPDRRYSAVLAQQGRVQLDSDANEQVLLELHRQRTLAADLIGPHGGPADALGFGIQYRTKDGEPADLVISAGRYYVDGILVDATRPAAGVPVEDDKHSTLPPPNWTYWDQPDAYRDKERPETDNLPNKPFVAYLQVTERLVTYVQDPAIRETALGPSLPDTAARLKVTWQVLARPGTPDDFARWVGEQNSTARLAARTERPAKGDDGPCLAAPDSRYRGEENQLYRLEIHSVTPKRTFKWSRENGSVVFGVASVDGGSVTLSDAGRDGKLDLDIGDWVELLDDATVAREEPADLLRVVDVDTERLRVELEGAVAVGAPGRHPFLRRWDHRPAKPVGGAVEAVERQWLDLEDGVQVWFEGGTLRPGDYWLIPARTITGDVEWARDGRDRPLSRVPDGESHHYAPLAFVDGGRARDLRRAFVPLAASVE